MLILADVLATAGAAAMVDPNEPVPPVIVTVAPEKAVIGVGPFGRSASMVSSRRAPTSWAKVSSKHRRAAAPIRARSASDARARRAHRGDGGRARSPGGAPCRRHCRERPVRASPAACASTGRPARRTPGPCSASSPGAGGCPAATRRARQRPRGTRHRRLLDRGSTCTLGVCRRPAGEVSPLDAVTHQHQRRLGTRAKASTRSSSPWSPPRFPAYRKSRPSRGRPRSSS